MRADRTEEEAVRRPRLRHLADTRWSTALRSWSKTEYKNAFEDGVDLSRVAESRPRRLSGRLQDRPDAAAVGAALRQATRRTHFNIEPLRNATSTAGFATFRFAADAVVTGIMTLGYRDMQPVDPLTKPFRGFIGIGRDRLSVSRDRPLQLPTAKRGTEYSFDAAEAYYVENALALSYTHRLFGDVDIQVRRGEIGLRLQRPRSTVRPHEGHTDTAAGSLGYNLRNRTRIAVNYEIARRRSPEIAVAKLRSPPHLSFRGCSRSDHAVHTALARRSRSPDGRAFGQAPDSRRPGRPPAQFTTTYKVGAERRARRSRSSTKTS